MSKSAKTKTAKRRRPTILQRRSVEQRANGTCEYCRCLQKYVPQPFNAEHIFPYSLGGQTVIANLTWACTGCNLYKQNKVAVADPVTGKYVKLFHPRHQSWNEHFAWNEDTTLMIGISATGRATIQALRLNREELTNFRAAFRILKLHPPQ